MTNRSETPSTTPSLRHSPFAALRRDGPAPASSVTSALPAGPATRAASPDGVRPGASAGRAALVVRREKKGRGGKAVTIAAGPALTASDLEALARAAAKALGAGARAEDGALVVQGEQTERLAAWLAGQGFTDIVRGN
ncbi:MAG: translation initiation factor [Planctomycetes bacterium]|nr:translation initiation factor [Planctomycetota bacterium]